MANRGSSFGSGGANALQQDDYLVSSNGAFHAILFGNGNFLIFRGSTPQDTPGSALWQTGKNEPIGPKRLVLYDTGVLCIDLNNPNQQIWESGPTIDTNAPPKPKVAVLHDDGNLCIYDNIGVNANMIWDTKAKDPVKNIAISSIKYDLAKAKISEKKIQGLYNQAIHNDTSIQQSVTLGINESITETQSWTNSLTVGAEFEQSFKVTVPETFESETKISLKVEKSITFNTTTEVTREWKFDIPLNIAPRTTVKVLTSVAMTTITVPYELSGTYILNSGWKVPGITVMGTFIGSNSHDVEVQYKELSSENTIPPQTIIKPQPENKAVVVADALHIRASHDPGAKILGFLKKQDQVTVLDKWVQGNQIWVKIKPGSHLEQPTEQWCAMLVGSNKYVQILDD